MLFVCPKCKGKLNIDKNGTAKCSEGHSYDRSRFGYYNLLLSEKGGTHGDNKEMVIARRKFLSRGFYEPLSILVSNICESLISDGGNILDAGCGEGYYTARVKETTSKKHTRIAAFDISKDAVKEASKRKSADEYAVAGSYHMPVADSSIDIVLNTFSPLAKEEVYRVLKPGGHFVMAIPGEDHLFGLKSAIYKTPYKNDVLDTELSGFILVGKETLKYELKLNTNEDIADLFMMTPYAYRTNAEGRGKILALENLSCEAHFLILVYRKDV